MAYVLDTYALATLDEVRDHLSIPTAVTAINDQLTRMINSSTAIIENEIDRQVLKRQYVEYHDGRNQDRILLRQWPAEKPTEIYEDQSSEFTDPNNIIATSDFDIDLDSKGQGIGVILLNGRYFRRGTRNIRITYNGGYDTVPYDLHEAAVLTVEWLYDMRSDRRIGVDSKSKNNENIKFLGDMPSKILKLLERYRRSEFPILSTQVLSV